MRGGLRVPLVGALDIPEPDPVLGLPEVRQMRGSNRITTFCHGSNALAHLLACGYADLLPTLFHIHHQLDRDCTRNQRHELLCFTRQARYEADN